MTIAVHTSAWPLCHMQEPFGPRKRGEGAKAEGSLKSELGNAELKWKTYTSCCKEERAMSGLCSLRFVMRGATPPRRRLGRRQKNTAAWFIIFFFLLLSPDAVSQGGQEQVHVREEDSHSSLITGGGGEHEQQQQLSRLGSRPPFCESKCGRCAPCTAVQVRAGAAEGRLRPQCANYEPVGWKCKCGAAVFDP